MDRALDDIIGDRDRRQRGGFRQRDSRPPRDGVRKPNARREEPRNIDSDWVHDRYDDDSRGPQRGGNEQGRNGSFYDERRRGPSHEATDCGAKMKIDNLHYDLTEKDIRELFSRKGDVASVQLLYDRQDRSRGIAYVTMHDPRDARDAVRDFDGANANGQPIRVSMIASAPSRPRNPFDTAERPASRSLFERVETRRSRSESPQPRYRARRPDPENIDRYVPEDSRGSSRRRSPMGPRRGGDRRGGGGAGGSRRPGERRGRSDTDGHKMVGGRPRKTQEELDAEMDDYWGGKAENGDAATGGEAYKNAGAGASAPRGAADGDVDMVE